MIEENCLQHEELWTVPRPATLRERYRAWKFGRRLKKWARLNPPSRATSVRQLMAWLMEANNPPRWGYNWGDGFPPDLGPYQKLKIQLDCLRAARR